MELILLSLILTLLVVILVIQLRKGGGGSADVGAISSRLEQIDVSQQKQGAVLGNELSNLRQ